MRKIIKKDIDKERLERKRRARERENEKEQEEKERKKERKKERRAYREGARSYGDRGGGRETETEKSRREIGEGQPAVLIPCDYDSVSGLWPIFNERT